MSAVKSKMIFLVGLMVLSLFLSGCLPLFSLQELYTNDTVVFDEKLLGKWYGEDQIWTFTRNGNNKYNLQVSEKGTLGQFEVHLVQLRDKLFLDLYPEKNDDLEHTPVIYQIAMMPLHVILCVQQIDEQLILRLVQLEDMLENDPNLIEHAEVDGCLVITAPPRKLQEVLINHFESEDVIDDEQHVFYRGIPLFSRKDIVFSENLLGQWESQDHILMDCIPWEKGYDIVFLDNQRELWLKGYQITLDGENYLAVFGGRDSKDESDLLPDLLFRIEQEGSLLKLYLVDLYKSVASRQITFDENDIQIFKKL